MGIEDTQEDMYQINRPLDQCLHNQVGISENHLSSPHRKDPNLI